MALIEGAAEEQAGVGDHGAQAVGVGEQLVDDGVDRWRAADLHQQLRSFARVRAHLLPQDLSVEQVLDADAMRFIL